MNNENRPTEVLIEREGKVWRWGQSQYLRTWNGYKFTLNTAVFKTMAMPIAILLGLVTFYSGKNQTIDSGGREFGPPNVATDLPLIDSKILSEQDLLNQARQVVNRTIPIGRIRILNLRAQTGIPVGSEAKAILESGATNGIVKAKLASPIFVDGEIIIPDKTTVVGRGHSSEERLFIEFNRAVLPNGETIPIVAQAFDGSDKILGLKGAFVGRKTKKMLMGMGFGLLGGMADGLQETNGSVFGYERKKTMREAALAGTAKAALDQSQVFLDEMKNSPDIIEVKLGTEFYLIIDESKQKARETNE